MSAMSQIEMTFTLAGSGTYRLHALNAFASSVIIKDGRIWFYYSLKDAELARGAST